MAKQKVWIAGGVVALILIIVVAYWVSTYGSLNSGREEVSRTAADVDATLQRRHDLIPNLVETVKGYAKHEEKVLREVTEARAKVGQMSLNIQDAALDPAKMKQLQQAQAELSSALNRLMIVVEKYPDLKAHEGFRDLLAQLEGTENRISVARQRYNEAVKSYNTQVGGFLARNVASFHGFEKAEYYEASSMSKDAPAVTFE